LLGTAHELSAQDRYRELAEHGQTPEIMVIGCCDTRVSPGVIFDAPPGDRKTGQFGPVGK
jgi:carbonic anhydrase